MQLLKDKLTKRRDLGTLRILNKRKNLIDFGSNDTLGLASSSRLQKLATEELTSIRKMTRLTGYCATGSRLLSGNHSYTENLEAEIAKFHGYEAALIFSCGYMANLGLISSIAEENDTLLFDARIHASIRDGMQLSKAKTFPFRHNDIDHLEKRLQSASSRCFVCIESVYSTDGTRTPLAEIEALCKHYGARLIVDETHAIGVYGPSGRGLAKEPFAVTASFGKALGAYGGVILGSHDLKSYLINFAHSLIYTTALPLQNLAPIRAAYALFPQMEKEREALHSLIELLPFSSTHIQPFAIHGNEKLLACAHYLESQGFSVAPLRSPTVRRGEELLRLSLHAHNTKEETLKLFHTLQKWKERHA